MPGTVLCKTRHLPLLRFVAALGCRIVAPHFPVPDSLIPTKAELDLRIRRLALSADEYCVAGLPIGAIGHSTGTVALLVLAGGVARTRAGELVTSRSGLKIGRLALFAPTTAFFRGPGALNSVRVPIRIWVGARDTISPPAQSQFLKDALQSQVPIEICLEEEAGHFSYMDELPPGVTDSHPDRSTFLASLAHDAGLFVIA
jgi:pimeloyl-ACP methyl ester carboxylesterase